MEKYINNETKKTLTITDMCNLVFENIVRNHLKELNYEKKITLDNSDIECIAKNIIYNDDMWNVIYECVDEEINYILEEKIEEAE